LFSADLGDIKFEQVRSRATDPAMTKRGRNKPPATRARGTWGGRRTGSGRPPSGPRSSEPHKTRPESTAHHAVVVTARVVDAVRRIDRSRAADALARAIDRSLDRDDFRIIHVALRTDTIDLIVEADDKHALARGMQGFQVCAARSLNRELQRTGTVFVDRYRARIVTTQPALAAAIARLPRIARTRIGQPTSHVFDVGAR
jgi:hypothetical protein